MCKKHAKSTHLKRAHTYLQASSNAFLSWWLSEIWIVRQSDEEESKIGGTIVEAAWTTSSGDLTK